MNRFMAVLTVVAFGVTLNADDAPQLPKAITDQLVATGSSYESWSRVDDELYWSPFLCRMPEPGKARISSSDDKETHGQKLYSLFAKNRPAYMKMVEQKPTEVGQMIVKQAWVPEEIKDDGKPLQPVARTVTKKDKDGKVETIRDTFLPFARKDGKLYKAEKQADLFVMMKVDPTTPATDSGWVYAVMSPDGSKIRTAGVVNACKACHEKAPYDRLFGSSKEIKPGR